MTAVTAVTAMTTPYRIWRRATAGARPAAQLACWFGAGFLPRAPGSWASLTALPLAWGAFVLGGTGAVIALSVCLALSGLWASAIVLPRLPDACGRDPPFIVIDEVAGQCLALAWTPVGIASYAMGFAAFRLFDILKPWPLPALEKCRCAPVALMADDMAAGLMAAGLTAALFHVLA